jgi:catechol 2,3-dioxygenase-like lactoylglutathione lyase family enzyme
MKFRLDHVVIAVANLDAAVRDYRGLGFTAQIGGRHPGRTSHNALVVFEDGAYLELIAWPEPGPAERWYNVLAAHGAGLMDFALIPEDVPRAIAEAKARGLALSGPIDGGRVRPDGRELRWRTARQPTFDLPFLCGDVTPREWRVPGGENAKHANGARGISQVSVCVADLSASTARYAALLGTDAGEAIEAGDCRIILSTFARNRGEGPCAISIKASGPGATAGLMDIAKTQGAHIMMGA